ncbi:MAG: HAD-IIB family hydrolase [Minisyncoccia bacterium]
MEIEKIGFQPHLTAFDLDGTLAESKQPLLPDMGALVARLMEKLPIAVLSGGSFAQFQKQFLSGMPEHVAESRLYIFPTNAAQCHVLVDGGWQKKYDYSFSDDEKQHVMHVLHDAMTETGFDKPPEKVWGERIEDRGSQISFSALGQLAPPEVKKAWDPTREKRMPLWKLLVERLPDFQVGLNATTTIDITRKGIDKAYGIRQLAEITGIAIADMLYIGDALWDGGNDSVVKVTGIKTHQVAGPAETAAAIEEIIAVAP